MDADFSGASVLAWTDGHEGSKYSKWLSHAKSQYCNGFFVKFYGPAVPFPDKPKKTMTPIIRHRNLFAGHIYIADTDNHRARDLAPQMLIGPDTVWL